MHCHNVFKVAIETTTLIVFIGLMSSLLIMLDASFAEEEYNQYYEDCC